MKACDGYRLGANLLTCSRLALLPFLLHCQAKGFWGAALALLIVMGLTDVFDGMLARLSRERNPLGGLLDIGADAALVLSIALLLCLQGGFCWYVGLLVPVSFAVYSLACLRRRTVIYSTFGKYAGALCLVCFGVIFISRAAGIAAIGRAASLLMALGLGLSILENLIGFARRTAADV